MPRSSPHVQREGIGGDHLPKPLDQGGALIVVEFWCGSIALSASRDWCWGELLHAPVRVYDLGRPVGMKHHYAVVTQQSPPLARFEPVEGANTRTGLRAAP